jgi:hypothetical protein
VRHYLSTKDVAEMLNISLNTLNTKIRADEFPPPDVLIGGHFQGWERATIEGLRVDETTSDAVACDFDQVCSLVTQIRTIAEHVRAYGAIGKKRGIAVTTPMNLHVIAARIESETRSWAQLDNVVANPWTTLDAAKGVVDPVSSVVPPRALSDEVRVAELRGAADRLKAVIAELPLALISKGGKRATQNLTAELESIVTFVGTFD